MNDRSTDLLERLAPALAPESHEDRDRAPTGVWSYRDGTLERLAWRGTESHGDELESALERAVWLFDERRDEGEQASVETQRGTAVLERGTSGVVVAWYESIEQDRRGASTSSADTSSALSAGSESVDRGHRTGSAARRTDAGSPVDIDLSESQPPVDRSGRQREANRRESPQARERSARSDCEPVSASSRHARPSHAAEIEERSPEWTSGEAAPSDEFHVQISFAETSSSPSEVEETREQTCRWSDVATHLERLTDVATEHLGKTVVQNYWREVIADHEALERRLDIELYGDIETCAPKERLDDRESQLLEAALEQWLKRCRRSLPAEAELVDTPPDAPWKNGVR
jgi:hypothetical protein